MERILQLHEDFYYRLKREKAVINSLSAEGIEILDGFIEQVDLVHRFYKEKYKNDSKRIVLCGINPGRRGAGKTGIPFIDFKSASDLLTDVNQNDMENSAQFIMSIIEEIGEQEFFDHVYMTNISWYGFTKKDKNLNYYKLPLPLQKVFTASFIEEMDILQPAMIVPVSKEVEKTLKKMVKDGELKFQVADRLPHPYYSSIKTNEASCRKMYMDLIRGFGSEQKAFV
ncbi:DUF4918 family protein [Sporosarcina sp. ACRSL]|uniref:uracil-DNA glycosylase family protein n=1 Tax=Sporosarcina sp. ACRSL TaxID=2918215 RepID=UPI001EF5568D|nr:uracil-DNA glycosylase family protein [Sporosarcina sp. ACRSL]MCG7344050.1 DUF4918 family protein [Sporosarcina sp. ACRSL]